MITGDCNQDIKKAANNLMKVDKVVEYTLGTSPQVDLVYRPLIIKKMLYHHQQTFKLGKCGI
jgi:hypothetical protein